MGSIKQTNTASVGTTPTKIASARTTYGNGRRDILVTNTHATAALFIGGSAVTASNGVKIAAGASQSMTIRDSDDLYGIASTGTGSATVLG